MRIGIDLGTSYSLAARLHPGGATALIPDARHQDSFHTPSTVVIAQGGVFVGRLAEDIVESDADLPAIRFFKRRLGDREAIYFDDRGRGWHAEGLSALILDKLRFDAETEGSREVEGAVIGVPAHFNDRQRRAVVAAASLADLPLVDLIDEPVAAALHYGVAARAHREVILAYDFGGGTFDATALTLDERGIYVLAKSGLTELGGKELDEKVGEMVLEQFTRALRARPELTARTLLELRRASEEIKIELCAPDVRRVERPVLLGHETVEVRIDRADLERAVEPFVEQTLAVTGQCLRESGLAPSDVTTVLMVGGSSLMPRVAVRLRETYGAAGARVLHHEPTKAVAFGAAVRAAQRGGDPAAYQLPAELKGVTGYHVGVRTVDPSSGEVVVDTLIKKNMPLPTRVAKTFYTTRPDQRTMVLDFVQYRDGAADAVPLGRLKIGPLERPRLNYPVSVRVAYQDDGTVAVRAVDAESGRELEQSFGGEGGEDIRYLAGQRKLLHAVRS
ncbi:MAG TPA: Hsp70 family protein [Thermoanaerobaculia bacterium]|nr:Hsp70 family protein [Thermoanaerobaculia bacterium]